jgi:hypothetical protein
MMCEGKSEPGTRQARRAAVAAMVAAAILYGLIAYSLRTAGPLPRVITATVEARPWYEAMRGQWTWLHDEYLVRESDDGAGGTSAVERRTAEPMLSAWVEQMMGAPTGVMLER